MLGRVGWTMVAPTDCRMAAASVNVYLGATVASSIE